LNDSMLDKVIAWFAGNHVAANLLMLLILVAGVLTIPQIRKETIPSVPLNRINISVAYPGASPTEAEKSVCSRIEEAIFDLDGIEELTSTASENNCTVQVEVQTDYNVSRLLDDIKSRVDGITSFPGEIEKPVIRELLFRNRAINVIVSGPTDEFTLKKLTERVRDDLLALPSITQVEMFNVKPYEISIELSDRALRSYGLSFAEVAEAIRGSSIDLAGGVVKTASGDVLLRTQNQAYRGEQFSEIPLRAQANGTVVTVGDVAHVVDGFKQSDREGLFNGQPASLLTVYRVGDQSILEISKEVQAYIAKTQPLLPEGIKLNTWQDNSKMFKSRLHLLLSNATMGLLLVFTLLVLFLRVRLALWVSAGIAVAFMGALLVLPQFDGSINMISMFAFVLVLGIVVDDAIIVGENIFSQHRRGVYGLAAAIHGAQDVAKPVIFAVLTSIAAFMPIFFLPGTSGKLWSVISVVVIATLVFSLLESLLILPAHLATINSTAASRFKLVNAFSRFQQTFVSGLENFILKGYRPFLALVLRWRYTTVSVFVGMFIIFIVTVTSGWLPMVFFPEVEGDMMVASVRFAQGTPVAATRTAVEKIQTAAQTLRQDLIKQTGSDEFRGIAASLGNQPMSRSGYSGSHVGEVAIGLAPAESRVTGNQAILNRWRGKIGQIPQAVELSFSSSLQHHGADIDLRLTGSNLDSLKTAAEALKTQLRNYTGVYDVNDSFESGKRELQIKLKPYAQTLGLDFNDLARQVRQAFYGEEVQRIQRGRDEVKVFVRFTEAERRSLHALEQMTIHLKNGADVPLSSVAVIDYGRSPAEIKRVNRKRIIRVTAYVDSTKASSGKIMADLKSGFLAGLPQHYRGVGWDVSGRQKNKKELIDSMIRGFILAMLGIYALMAIPFRSYLQPLIVVSAIPFGLIGAILGHLLLGLDISLLSLSGMIAVSGVVVNDNLVLVDYINRACAQGMPVAKAIREAGTARFRPIMLTSLTTFAGLTPLMLEKSVQAQFLIPMAVSLAFGVIFATTVSLLLIPSAYHILEDIKSLFQREPIPQPVSDSQLP
jgi:multidrug efflux pump subunit AcrB